MRRLELHPNAVDFVCGAAAGCAAMASAMPLDVVRTRLVAQGEPRIYRGAVHAIVSTWRAEGVRGFFRGCAPSLAQIAPFTGLQFTCYNALDSLWNDYVRAYGELRMIKRRFYVARIDTCLVIPPMFL